MTPTKTDVIKQDESTWARIFGPVVQLNVICTIKEDASLNENSILYTGFPASKGLSRFVGMEADSGRALRFELGANGSLKLAWEYYYPNLLGKIIQTSGCYIMNI